MPLQIAATLAHELTHAAVGIQAKHGKAFATVAKGLGLTGKMAATVPGPEFDKMIAPLCPQHGAMTPESWEGLDRAA